MIKNSFIMVSSIKITKLNNDKVQGYAYNMVSVKKYEVSTARLNKGCTIRKKPDLFFSKTSGGNNGLRRNR
jgi:hypothetical protein